MPASHDALLRALVLAVAPRAVVEVAPTAGSSTTLILEAGSTSIGTLDRIGGSDADTSCAPPAAFTGRLRRHEGLTLNALAALSTSPDLVVLGGDPNWYTVFHALRLLARSAGSAPYPLTLVRDAGWPYGRRDAYPQPEIIPATHLQPHAQRGLRPGKSELDHGGLHDDTHHSIYEGTEKNGVRTAVEDFIAESGLPLDLLFVPGFHGVALVIDHRRTETNGALATLLGELQASTPIVALLDELERARLDADVQLAAQRTRIERRVAERAELAGEIAELRSALDGAEREAGNARALELRIAELDATKATLEEIVVRTETELRDARARVAELESQTRRLEEAHARSSERERALADAEAQLAKLRAPREGKSRLPESERGDHRLHLNGASKSDTKRAENGVHHPEARHAQPPKRRQGANGHVNGAPKGVFARAIATATPAILQPASLELASRRFAKLRRDPKLFLAHSRFELARKLARLL